MTTRASRSYARSSWHKPTLALMAIALIAPFADLSRHSQRLPLTGTVVFASAQKFAGKFASRTKLEGSSQKKKRKFWGNRSSKEVKEDDGESYTSNTSSSWKWELFLVESRMIFISCITSVLCAALSWIWYSRPRSEVKNDGEEGGE